jgi:DtxR family Mn-dependent transcriptional regulator
MVMSHDRDLADQDIEEVAEELWTLGEQGSDRLSDLRETTRVANLFSALEELSRRGLARLQDDRVQLTPQGRELAARQVRRHRLAEALFTTVLEVHDDEAVNQTACVMEHVLSGGIADSICAFLGHPVICPHGKPIPSGACCRSFTRTVQPLVQPVDQLAIGEEGRVVFISPRVPERMTKLSNLGVVPGATVRLQQRKPAAVLRVGETTLALDSEAAGEIYVKKVS